MHSRGHCFNSSAGLIAAQTMLLSGKYICPLCRHYLILQQRLKMPQPTCMRHLALQRRVVGSRDQSAGSGTS